MTMFATGCPFEDKPTGIYRAWSIPLVVKTGPLRNPIPVSNMDGRVMYQGSWQTSGEERLIGLAHSSSAAGSSAQLAFHGTEIEYVAVKKAGFGKVDIYIDDTIAGTVELESQNLPRFSGVIVLRSRQLVKGQRSIRIVNKSGKPIVLDSFNIYA